MLLGVLTDLGRGGRGWREGGGGLARNRPAPAVPLKEAAGETTYLITDLTFIRQLIVLSKF